MNDDLRRLTRHTDAGISTIHHVLRAPRRRLIILLIFNHHQIDTDPDQLQNPITARELAKWIVATEESISQEQATGDAYHNSYTAVTQVHLPRLDNVGAVQYNSDRKTVTPGPNLQAFATIASVTSPLTQHLFHKDIASLYERGHEHKGKPQSPIEEESTR